VFLFLYTDDFWRYFNSYTAKGIVFIRDPKGSSRTTGLDRGCVKTKTDLAVNPFCKIQTSKSRRFELGLGFLARFVQFAKVPRVFTRPRPSAVSDEGLLSGISPRSLELNIRCQELRAPMAQSTLVLA
jgi:hypothetical protein